MATTPVNLAATNVLSTSVRSTWDGMAYYSQVQAANEQGISLAGISGTPAIRFTLATDYSAGISISNFWYLCDGRWPSGDGSSYILQSGGDSPNSSGISNIKINGVASSLSDLTSTVADDVIEFTATGTGTAIVLFNRYTLNEAADALGIYDLEVDDDNGTHVFDIAGTSTGDTITDSLGSITATVENAPVDDSQWVAYVPSVNLQYRDLDTLTTTTVTGIDALFYDFAELTPSTQYEFRVQEDDSGKTSDYSDWFEFQTAVQEGYRCKLQITGSFYNKRSIDGSFYRTESIQGSFCRRVSI